MDVFAQHLVIVYAFVFVVGAVVGSFLNVLIYRLPREISIVRTPPSSCPGCSTPIRWYDNIPLLSWIVLRGRCRQWRQSLCQWQRPEPWRQWPGPSGPLRHRRRTSPRSLRLFA